MKKIFTLSLALAATATAFAANPNVKVANEMADKSVKVNQKADAVESKCADVKVLRDDIMPAKAPAAAAGDAAVTLQYAYPVGTMFNYMFFSVYNTPGYWSSSPTYCTVPALDAITFRNNSFYMDGADPKRAKEGYEYTWTFEFTSGEKTENTEYNLEWPTEPSFYYGYGIYTPKLSMGDNQEFQLGQTIESQTTGEENFYPTFIVTGGGNYISDEDKDYYENNNGWTDMEVAYKLYNASYKGAESYYTSNVFNIGDRPASGYTMADIDEAWEVLMPEGGEISDFELVAMGQLFPDPGQPWSISKMDLTVYGHVDAGATFDVCFYALGEDNTIGELIKKFTYTCEQKMGTASQAAAISFEIPFTTVDEIGDELGYQIIDGGMFMMFEGLRGNSKIHAFAPTVGAYPHKKGVINNLSDYNLYGLVQYKEDGVEKTSMVANRYSFGTEDATEYSWPVTFNFQMVAEYPYMMPLEVFTQSSTEWEEVEADADGITVELKNDGDYSTFQVYCSGTVEDIYISRVGEDTELPEWLSVGVENAADYFTNLTGEPRAYVIQLALTDGANPGGCEVAVEYKGVKNIYKVNPDLSGIEGVVNNNVETVASEYYDLQGRKLYGEPQNGLFIRKDIKADGSVKASKVVK